MQQITSLDGLVLNNCLVIILARAIRCEIHPAAAPRSFKGGTPHKSSGCHTFQHQQRALEMFQGCKTIFLSYYIGEKCRHADKTYSSRNPRVVGRLTHFRSGTIALELSQLGVLLNYARIPLSLTKTGPLTWSSDSQST